jgi:hypothetical protein
VIVSVDPDWEAGHLVPVLNRASSSGSRAYLRVAPDRWIRSGTMPEVVPEQRVRSEAAASDLLIVQGSPGELPDWLARTAARHDRLLMLVRGPGEVPGTGLTIGELSGGDWFALLPPPASPVARVLAGLDSERLPPAFTLRSMAGTEAWPILEFRRDRRGDPVPGVVGLRTESGRRVIVLAEGTWRWSARTGPARTVYRALYGGIAAWLLEEFRPEPVTLAPGGPRVVAPTGWELAPGISSLVLMVRDALGTEVWRDSLSEPGTTIALPPLAPGELSFQATGMLEGSSFAVERPFAIPGAVEELGGRPIGRSLTTGSRASSEDRRMRPPNGSGLPVWPFLLAAILFCVEWYLRRRLGLR